MLVRLFEDNPNDREIRKIVELLRNGGVIIYPTDTIYAIGCDINSVKAVQRVCALRGVKPEKAVFARAIHVCVAGHEQVAQCVDESAQDNRNPCPE